MISLGFLSLIASCLLYSLADSVYLFYLGGCLLGLGLAWTTTTLVGYLVDRWFAERKGTVMGIILAANGLGGAAASQIISPLIYGSRADGWRSAYRLTALLLAAVGVLVVLFIRQLSAQPYPSSPSFLEKHRPHLRAENSRALRLERHFPLRRQKKALFLRLAGLRVFYRHDPPVRHRGLQRLHEGLRN